MRTPIAFSKNYTARMKPANNQPRKLFMPSTQNSANDAEIYRVFVLGYPVEQFEVHSVRGFIHFNLLNLSAVLMLVGLVLSVKLRMSDQGELAIQTFADDVLPLLLLFTVSITGLMLTVSSHFMAGAGFQFLGMAHDASVIGFWLALLACFDVVFVTLALWTFEPLMTD